MAINRDDLHDLVEKIPVSEIEKIKFYLKKIIFDSQVEEIEPTQDDIIAIDEAEKQFENGEYYSFEEAFEEDE